MGVLVLLFLIFLVTVIIIWVFPPDNMADEEGLKASVKDLWGVVKICQTSNFGKPSLKLKPAKRSVEMNLHFPDADIGGLGLLLINEWARRRFDIENWVWFFGLVRIEMMIAMIAVFAPAYALFLYSKRSTSSN